LVEQRGVLCVDSAYIGRWNRWHVCPTFRNAE
jgi:hypothetical protein